MSGEELRRCATMDDAEGLKHYLAGGANPCSQDKSGLTPLHLAVWNGHLECVEVLMANDKGTNTKTGDHCSSIELQSDSGFTALHLSVSQTETEDSLEITKFLIMSGCSWDIEDTLNRTPDELCDECENTKALKLFDLEPPNEEERAGYLAMVREKHHCQTHREFDFSRCEKDENGNYIITREDKLPVPVELSIPEHHIFPHAKESFGALRKDGASAIRDLVMLVDQSYKNEVRRDRLANNVEHQMRGEAERGANRRAGNVSVKNERHAQ